MHKTDDILEGARAIRPFLKALLGGEAEAVDQGLAELLQAGREGKKVDNLILELVRGHEHTRSWMAEFLERKLPPELARGLRGYTPPRGGEPVPAPKYVCPKRDYTWYRPSVRDSVPTCPTHGVKLEPAD